MLRICVILLAIGSTIFEIFVDDLGHGPLHDQIMNIENPKKKKTPLKSMNIIFIIVFLTTLFVQVRIIYYKSKSYQNEPVVNFNLDKSDCESQTSEISNVSDSSSCNYVQESITYTKGTLLLIVLLILVCGIFVLSWLLRAENHSLERLVLCVVQSMIIHIVIPIILIVRNQSMMNHGKSMINSKILFMFSSISKPTKPKEIEEKNSENSKGNSPRTNPTEVPKVGTMHPNPIIPKVVISNDFTVVEC